MLIVISCNWDLIPKGMGRVTVNLPVINSNNAKSLYTCTDQTTNYIVTIFSPYGQKSEQISSNQTSVTFDVAPGDYTIVVFATNEYSSTETDSYNYITGSAIHRTSIREGDSTSVPINLFQIGYNAVANIYYTDAITVKSIFTTGITEIKLSGNILSKISYTGSDKVTHIFENSYNSGMDANSTLGSISFPIDLPKNIETGMEIDLEIKPESFEGVIDGVNLHTLHPTDKKYYFYPPPEKFYGTVSDGTTSMFPVIGGENVGNVDIYEEDDTLEDATPLSLNEIQEHNFVDDGNDWVKVEVEKDYLYTFQTTVSGITDTSITLYDSEMNKLADNDDGDGNEKASKIQYIFKTGGTFFLSINSFEVIGNGTNYTVTYTRTEALQPMDLDLPMEQKKWTVLVYLDADNDLEDYGDLDITEMTSVGSTDEVNIVVLWDNMKINHGYYYIENGSASFVKELYEINMGEESTATDFINWVVDNFPADHYMFDYWNHGKAVDRSENTFSNLQGIAWDDTNGSDWLNETEQKNIIEFFYNKINRPIDIVSYDACLMATAEIAYMYKGYANYLVASEEEEPKYGWDYKFLETVTTNPDISAANLANNILTYYMNSYADTGNLTFSVTNLLHIDKFAIALDTFCSAAIATGDENGSIFNSLTTDVADFSGYTRDLYGYLANVVYSDNPVITTEIKGYAKNIMAIIRGDISGDLNNDVTDDLIIHEAHGSNWTNKAYGLSITMKADTDTYSLLDICEDTSWDEFLDFCGFYN